MHCVSCSTAVVSLVLELMYSAKVQETKHLLAGLADKVFNLFQPISSFVKQWDWTKWLSKIQLTFYNTSQLHSEL